MAIGLLGAARVFSVGSATVYTVPAGISHAVAHLTLSVTTQAGAARGLVSVQSALFPNPVAVLRLNYDSTNTGGAYSSSVSMMLSPGDVVSVDAVDGATFCTVSGYEVP